MEPDLAGIVWDSDRVNQLEAIMEERECLDCGESWNDTGSDTCPFCESTNTAIVDFDEDTEED